MTDDSKVILKVADAKRLFGSLRAVDGISFEVYEGEIFGIAGPNGSGKTTLMNLITQVIPMHGGEIFFRGKPIHTHPSHRICHEGIGRTYQNPTVFESMSVFENMQIGLTFGRNHNRLQSDLPKIQEVLDFVGFDKPLDIRAGKLMVNDKKKLMIAIALVADPKLLILDEPCAGLNVIESKESIELIKKIGSQGITVMLIEHNMQVLMNISDRVMVMDAGKQLCLDTPGFVCSNEAVIEKYLGKNTAKGVKDIAES